MVATRTSGWPVDEFTTSDNLNGTVVSLGHSVLCGEMEHENRPRQSRGTGLQHDHIPWQFRTQSSPPRQPSLIPSLSTGTFLLSLVTIVLFGIFPLHFGSFCV